MFIENWGLKCEIGSDLEFEFEVVVVVGGFCNLLLWCKEGFRYVRFFELGYIDCWGVGVVVD